MSRFGLIPLVVAGAMLATAAEADQKGNKGPYSLLNCPPGLAKKNPPCIPPGQVKNHSALDRVIILPAIAPDVVQIVGDLVLVNPGDVLLGDHILVVDPQI